MKIFITGGSGFVGTNVAENMIRKGHTIVATGTSPSHRLKNRVGFEYIAADTTVPGEWQSALADADVVLNLAGRTIFHYWTDSYKKQIYNSRILTTRNVVDALPQKKDGIFLSASAIGYYGGRGDDTLSEESTPGNDFLAEVCIDWEKEALRAAQIGFRVVTMRFGVVLGKNGGALSKMIPLFKLFLGGTLGNGQFWFPWVHLSDLISIIDFLVETKEVDGAVNVCAPGAVRYREFVKALAQTCHRPALFRTPAMVMRFFMGEFGASLMNSQKAVPQKLFQHKFSFEYPELKEALLQIVA